MYNGRKIKPKSIVQLIITVLLLAVTFNCPANYSNKAFFYKTLTVLQDTVPVARVASDSTMKDTMIVKSDTFGIKVSKDSLDAPINYSASDSVVMDIPSKKIILYNKANTKYKDITLDAYKIELDQPKQIVIATYTTDTAGQVIGKPKMVEGENTMESDSIIYNLKNQKGITKNTFTQSGEMYVHGDKMKKVSENVYYALRGRFTTCNMDPPHFAFIANKMKLVNKKFAITGPVHPEFEGVPIPIYLPFGFFPMSQGRHSGLLPPAFTSSPQFGLGLEGLGYYKVLSDNFDVLLRANLYSYGGWNLYLTPEYRVRYRYNGRLNFTLQKSRLLSTTGKQQYTDSKTFSLAWSHLVDTKARPGTTFSANVNISSQKFNQYVYNNPTLNFTNQLSSSIAYSKTWNGRYNLTVNANHSQNNQTGLIQLNLPSIGFTATTIYPLQKKEFIGTSKWYEKLGIGLTTNFTNQANIFDSLFSFHKLIDTFQWGAQHNIPISLTLPPLLGGALQVGPGVSFSERWYSKKIIRTWNPVAHKLDTAYHRGFFTANDVAFSFNLSTALFGVYNKFGKKSSIMGIRHVIRPTFGLSYKPDLSAQYYHTTYVNDSTTQRLSVFEGSSYGTFAEGRFGGISFGLDNNLELKLRSKTDTSDAGIKKVKLIDGFGFNGSYNYLADSFKLSPIGIYIRSTLGAINITGGATLNPYVTDTAGNQKNIYAWNNRGKKFSLGSITTGNLAISTRFQSKPKDAKKAEADKQFQDQQNQLPMTMDEQMAELEYIRNNPAQFADFNITWTLNVSFSLSFSKVFRRDYSGFNTVFNSSLNWSGDFNLTPEWKVGLNSYYDVKNSKIQSLTMYLSRNLHCWQMSINVTPVGLYRSFNITLSPKSGILRDLKINRTRTFTD